MLSIAHIGIFGYDVEKLTSNQKILVASLMDGEITTFGVKCAMLVNSREIAHPFKLKFEIQTENEVDTNKGNKESFEVKNFINVNYNVNIKHNEGEETRIKLNIFLIDGNKAISSKQLDFSFCADDSKIILDRVLLGGIEFKFLFSIESPSFHKHEFVSNIPCDIRYIEISDNASQFLKKNSYDKFIDLTEKGRNYTILMGGDPEYNIFHYFMLDHPNILRAAGYTFIDGKIRLAFDFADLEPLSNFKGKFDFQMMMTEISSAMSYLHSLGFVNLGLAPGSILVDSNCSVKISSFSINNHDDYFIYCSHGYIFEIDQHPTKSDFMAPEIEFRSYDFRFDVYSAGVVAFYIICKQNTGFYHHLETFLFDLKKGKLIEFLPCDVQTIIRKMIADDPVQRPTFAEVIIMLNSIRKQDEGIELKLNPCYEAGDDYLFHLNSKTNIGLFHCLMYHRLHGNKDKEIEMARHFQFPCDDFVYYYSRCLTLSDDEIRNDEELVIRYKNLDKSDYRFYLMPPPSAMYQKMKCEMNYMEERTDDHRLDKMLSLRNKYHQMIYEMNRMKEIEDYYRPHMIPFSDMNCNKTDAHFPINETYQVGQIFSQSDDLKYRYFFRKTKEPNGRKMDNKQICNILVVEDKVMEINKNAETVMIPQTVKYIGKRACKKGKIVSLEMQNTKIIKICNSSFSSCKNLLFVSIPSSLEVICRNAFNFCDQLEKIVIPSDSKLNKICCNAFYNCYKLEGFDFPHMLRFIGFNAFNGCDSIKKTEIDLRKTRVTQIERDAFKSKSIKVVMLPATVSTKSIINCCYKQIIVDRDHQYVKSDDYGNIYLYNTLIQCNKKSKHALIRRGIEKISARCFYKSNIVLLTLPASVVQISERAFEKCNKLKWIQFPKNSRLIEIQSDAFIGCSVKRLNFPKSLKRIGSMAFNGCRSLESVHFPHDSQLEAIDNMFYDTKIKHLSIPPSVRRIGNICLGMNELMSISLSNYLFESSADGKMILSKDGSELVCVVNNPERLVIPESVRVIKRGAFNFTNLEDNFIIPANIEVIEDNAFCRCMNLKRLEFEAGSRLKFLGENSGLNSTKHLFISPN